LLSFIFEKDDCQTSRKENNQGELKKKLGFVSSEDESNNTWSLTTSCRV